MPKISFLTPTFNNPGLLRRAIESLQAQTFHDWEMVISPDDGKDYSSHAALDRRIRLVNAHGIVRSGPGPTRSRALMEATGEFVACLDDDDKVANNFADVVIRYLESSPAVTVPSHYITEDGKVIRQIGGDLASMNIENFSHRYGTMHTIAHRSVAKPWSNVFAEDVLHTCQVIDSLGGRIPVAVETAYFITVRPGSVCATSSGVDINRDYSHLAKSGFPFMTKDGEIATQELFRKRLEMSRKFELRDTPSDGYHEFVLKQTIVNPTTVGERFK